MDNMIDRLCLKRLCLPSNTDIDLLHNGKVKSNLCNCDTSKHIAIVIKNGCDLNPLSYGFNTYDDSRSDGTIHAEINAINNLITHAANKKRLTKIDILVIRTSKTGKIGMSKPCIKCIIDLSTLPQRKGYILKNIFYSNSEGLIVKTTLRSLIDNRDFHISRYYLNRNFKFDL